MNILLVKLVDGLSLTNALLYCLKAHNDYIYYTHGDAFEVVEKGFECPHQSIDAIVTIINKDTDEIIKVIISRARRYKGSFKLSLENLFEIPSNHLQKFTDWYREATGSAIGIDVKAPEYLQLKEADGSDLYKFISEMNKELAPKVVAGPYASLEKSGANEFSVQFEKHLHPLAQRSKFVKRYHGKSSAREQRTEFQRDKERILHSKAFRRMVDKAQVFTSSKGDHYRTRLTHTLEVAQIARGVARALSLNEDLAEAIALGHDLGHTPFGHEGERELDIIMSGKTSLHKSHVAQNLGGFKHNFQGLRMVCHLEEKYISHEGLDLSYQVLDGILKHTRTKRHKPGKRICEKCQEKCYDITAFTSIPESEFLLGTEFPSTLEGQIVFWADEIAQRAHDLDDGIASGVIDISQLLFDFEVDEKLNPITAVLRKIKNEINESKRSFVDKADLERAVVVSQIIHLLLSHLIKFSSINIGTYTEKLKSDGVDPAKLESLLITELVVKFDEDAGYMIDKLEDYVSSKVINSEEVNAFDGKAAYIVRKLFKAYFSNPKQLPNNVLRRIARELAPWTPNVTDIRTGTKEKVQEEILNYQGIGQSCSEDEVRLKHKTFMRCVADHIGSMTDEYANQQFNKLYIPS